MAGLINQLMEVLQSQVDVYDELIVLAADKKGYIINNDTKALSSLTANENGLVGKAQKLDRNRVALMQDICTVLNTPDDQLTLTALSRLLEGQKEQALLNELIDMTRSALEKLKELNDQNRILVQNSLEYIDFTMNIIRSSLMKEPSFYTAGGSEIGGKAFFDAKQ